MSLLISLVTAAFIAEPFLTARYFEQRRAQTGEVVGVGAAVAAQNLSKFSTGRTRAIVVIRRHVVIVVIFFIFAVGILDDLSTFFSSWRWWRRRRRCRWRSTTLDANLWVRECPDQSAFFLESDGAILVGERKKLVYSEECFKLCRIARNAVQPRYVGHNLAILARASSSTQHISERHKPV